MHIRLSAIWLKCPSWAPPPPAAAAAAAAAACRFCFCGFTSTFGLAPAQIMPPAATFASAAASPLGTLSLPRVQTQAPAAAMVQAAAAPPDELAELIEFLDDSRPPIKQHAAELVQGLTGSPEGIAQLAARSATLLPPLFRLVPAGEATSRAALVALVNLSQEPHVQQQLLGLNAVGRCMDYLREKACPGRNALLVMLLANLTSLEAGAEALLQVGVARRQAGRGARGASGAPPAGADHLHASAAPARRPARGHSRGSMSPSCSSTSCCPWGQAKRVRRRRGKSSAWQLHEMPHWPCRALPTAHPPCCTAPPPPPPPCSPLQTPMSMSPRCCPT